MEIDPVILQLRADVDRYIRDLRRAQGESEDRIRRMEDQFRRSSSNISLSLNGIAGTLATAFTGQQLIALIDQFTRFQNSLKVAGLEGERLAEVQDRLFQSGARYGVSVNALADLYGKAEQAGRDLGASQSQLLSLTDAVAQSLLVSGVSTEQASGAILGLSQALASGTVRAEEFNQINEGGLRVLLEAAAAGEQYGGSVARLRAAVVDGKVSSDQFFRSILANTDLIEGRAANANLTLSGAIQSLNDSLARYVGEASNANGVTGALTAGIQKLSENLDILIPALATIAAILAGRLAVGLAATAVNAVALRVIALGLAVQLNGVAAAATLAGRALLAGLGGPVGLAIGALAIGLTLVATRTTEAERAAQAYAKGQETAAKATDSARQAAERLASAHGATRAEALAAAKAEAELTKQKIASAKASLQQAQAELARLRVTNQRDVAAAARSTTGAGGGIDRLAVVAGRDGQRLTAAEDRVQRQRGTLDGLQKSLGELTATINSASAPAVAAVSVGSAGGSSGRGGGPTGPDAADIELRFRNELDSIRSRINAAEAQRATTAEQRAEYELRQLEFAEDTALRELAADEEYSAVQKDIIRERLLALGEAERDAITFRERAELEREQLDLLEERGRASIDTLRLQFDLADTERERRAIALQILDAENELLRSRLQAVIDSETAQEIDKRRAEIALEALNSQEGAQRASTELQFEGPLARFARNTRDTDTLVEEAAVRRIEDLNQTITDAMTNALGIKDPFLSQLIKIFLDRNVFGPLADALSGQGGGAIGGLGGALGSLIGGLFGRASGGRVSGGRAFRVNEGAPSGRVEGFIPDNSGQIIPLGRMNALQAGGASSGGVVRIMIEEAPGFAARVRTEAAGVAVEVVRRTAPQIVDAAANETLNRASRPKL
jgi:tape measure domain-containing protein